jgi:hypothetical protein
MADPAETENQNILPVQALFNLDNSFNTFIGQGQPFYASVNPSQTGLNITNSTINSTTIGATSPSSAAFTTATVSAVPTNPNDVTNRQYVDSYVAGLSWKPPVNYGTTANITLSGLAVQAGGDWTASLTAGMRVLVKNQSTQANNGIYVVASGAWTRSTDADLWDEFVSAICFVESGTTLAGSAWYCPAQPGGTLGVTAITWSNFSVAATYTAGTGLTLSSYQFSITNTGVSATTYGSASSVPVVAVNAQGQITSATSTAIAIANTQVSGLGTMSTQNANGVAITGGTINGTTVGATTAAAVTGTTITATSDFSGPGTNLSGTAGGLSIGGNAATATTATTATNIAGGAAGSVPYQSTANTTAFLGAGSNGQVLTLAAGIPSWATPTTGTVTSIATSGTVSGITLTGGPITTSGTITLGGTLDLSAPPAIGGTTANTITGTTVTATTKVVSPYVDAASSAGGALRTSGGSNCLQWGGGGGVNLTLDGAFNMNPANATIQISPTGTGTLTVNPATAGTMNNMAIGGTTAAAGSFTTLAASSTVSANGSVGSSGQVLTSAGAGSPAVWATPAAYATVTDDTTTNATRYILFADQTTGNLTTEYVSSTKLKYNPSTGALTASQLIIAP